MDWSGINLRNWSSDWGGRSADWGVRSLDSDVDWSGINLRNWPSDRKSRLNGLSLDSGLAVVEDEVDVDLVQDVVDGALAGVAAAWSSRLNLDGLSLPSVDLNKSLLQVINLLLSLESLLSDCRAAVLLAERLELVFELLDLILNVGDLDVVSVENDGLLGFDGLDLSEGFNVVLSGNGDLLLQLLFLSLKHELLGVNLVEVFDDSLASFVVRLGLALVDLLLLLLDLFLELLFSLSDDLLLSDSDGLKFSSLLSQVLLHLLDLLVVSVVFLLFGLDLDLDLGDLSLGLGRLDFELDVELLFLEDLLLGLDLLADDELEFTVDLVLDALLELGFVFVQQLEGVAGGEGDDLLGGLELVLLVVLGTLSDGYAR